MQSAHRQEAGSRRRLRTGTQELGQRRQVSPVHSNHYIPHLSLGVLLEFCCPWARRGGAVVKVLALHAQDPIWAPVLIPAAPLPIQLPACGPGKQSRTVQGFGTLHPRGRPGRGSWLRIASARCAHLGSESSDGRSSSLSLLSVYPPFQ